MSEPGIQIGVLAATSWSAANLVTKSAIPYISPKRRFQKISRLSASRTQRPCSKELSAEFSTWF